MAEKTIMKLHTNGDLETLVPLIQEQLDMNLYVAENSVAGYIDYETGSLMPQAFGARTSEFIPVIPGKTYVFHVTWLNSVSYQYAIGYYYDSNNAPVYMAFSREDGALAQEVIISIPANVAYVRLTSTHLETGESSVRFLEMESSKLFKFHENSITVPQIIQQPPYKNHFIKRTSVAGYLNNSDGQVLPPNDYDRTSDYINVEGWSSVTVRLYYKGIPSGSPSPWLGIYSYTPEKYYHMLMFDDYIGTVPVGDYIYTFKQAIPQGSSFIRVSASYYDYYEISLNISVEQGDTQDKGHVLAIEDMSTWAKYTNAPVSFYPQGIVIKGNLIQSP